MLTFPALSSNFGLQIIHLHLKVFNSFWLFTTRMAIPAKNNDNNDENEKNSTTHSNPNFNRNNFVLLLFKVLKITQRKIKITNHNLSQTKQKLNKALSNT